MIHHRKQRNRSVARLRKILKLTQSEFARMIGVSLDLIKGIETGRNRLTPPVAARIFVATGADVGSLREGNGEVKYLHARLDYRPDHFTEWTKQVYAWTPEYLVETFRSLIGPHMLLLLLAASRPMRGKVRNRLASLLHSWAQWEADAVKSFGLQRQINDVIRQCSARELEWAGAKWSFKPGLHSLPEELVTWLSKLPDLSIPPLSERQPASR